MSQFPSILLRTPAAPFALERRRLIDAVMDPAVPAALIVGPAGSGKTVLASTAVREISSRVLWTRAAPGFDGAADLVGMALVAAGKEPATEGAGLLDLAGDLLDLLESEPTTVVFDDYHHMRGDETDPLVSEVLSLMPRGSRVILCSRSRPAGLLGRVATGSLCLVSAPDLAFTETETAELFRRAGKSDADARDAWENSGGWALAAAACAESPQSGDVRQLVGSLLLDKLNSRDRQLVVALAFLPYLTDDLARHLGLGDRHALEGLSEQTSVVSAQGGYWRLDDIAAETCRASSADDFDVKRLRSSAAAFLANEDPPASIDLFLEAGMPESAADVLAEHVSEMGVRRAVHWLYKLPAELRHRFPPVLAFGQATVDLDSAVAEATRRVSQATTEPARREALYSLGSALVHSGSLAAAASALEAAGAPGGPASLVARAQAWLGVVRWWSGDLAGAWASLGEAGDDAFVHWARGEVAMARGDSAAAATWAKSAVSTWDPNAPSLALGRSLLARLALADGDLDRARLEAVAAYERAAATGGFELGFAAMSYAWVLLADGDPDTALTVADLVERRVGRHDALASLGAALIRVAVGRMEGGTGSNDRDWLARAERRVRQLRELGFAPVQAQALSLVPALQEREPEAALRVVMLGAGEVQLEGRRLHRDEWRSKKAYEVLRFLALGGVNGVTRDQAVEAVWPEHDPVRGRTLLRQALSEIRRVLEPQRPPGEPSRFLHATSERLTLSATTDVAEVRRLAKERASREALLLFGGQFLEDDPYAEWATEERRSLEALRANLAEEVARDDAAPLDERVAAFELLIAAEPWHDDHYTQFAGLYRRHGDEIAARGVERRRDFDG